MMQIKVSIVRQWS